MRQKNYFVIKIIICCSNLALSVNTAFSNDLNLKQAYQAALLNDASIRASNALTESVREKINQARSSLLPQISASFTRNQNNLESTTPNLFGNSVVSNDQYFSDNRLIQLRQPLINQQRWFQFQQAKNLAEEAEANLERELQNLLVRVTSSYFENLMAEEQLILVLIQKKNHLAILDAAKKRFLAGSGTRTDIDEAQARLDLIVSQELEAIQNKDLMRRQLQTMVNQPFGKLAKVNVQALKLTPPDPVDIESWIGRAELSSQELKAMKAKLEAAKIEVNKAQAAHMPTLDAIAQWSNSGRENITNINSRYENKSIGLQLNIPLYSGGYMNSTIRQAVAEQTRAEETLEALRRDLGVRVHREYRGVSEGVMRVRALEQAVRSAEQMVASTQMSQKGGSRTQLDVLNAQQQYTLTLRDLAQARLVYLLSKVRLASLVGEDAMASLEQVNGSLAAN